MKPATILTLAVGDRIRRNMGPPGAVTRFHRDMVRILWDGAQQDQSYTDGELTVMGATKMSAFDDVEDTRPE